MERLLAHVGGQDAKRLRDDGREARRRPCLCEPCERDAEPLERGPPKRVRGVAAAAVRDEPHVEIALLGEADVDERGSRCAVGTGVHEGRDALVERECRAHAPPGELGGDGGCTTAVRLLVLPEREDEGPSRSPMMGEQELDGLELTHQHLLYVERSTTPDPLVVDVPAKGVMDPLPLRTGNDVDYVLVCEEQSRRQRRIGARDGDENGVSDSLCGPKLCNPWV